MLSLSKFSSFNTRWQIPTGRGTNFSPTAYPQGQYWATANDTCFVFFSYSLNFAYGDAFDAAYGVVTNSSPNWPTCVAYNPTANEYLFAGFYNSGYEYGRISKSTDLITCSSVFEETTANTRLSDILWDGVKYIALARTFSGTTLYTGSSSSNITKRFNNASLFLAYPASSGTAIVLIGGATLYYLTSPFTTLNSIDFSAYGSLLSNVYAFGKFWVTTSSGSVLNSTNGINWTASTTVPSTTGYYSQIGFGGGILILAEQFGNVSVPSAIGNLYISSNGSSWKNLGQSPGQVNQIFITSKIITIVGNNGAFTSP